MTDKIRKKLDAEMMLKWQQYVYKEVTNGSKRNFQHINRIVDMNGFKKVYLNNSLSLWVFVLCDGEYGFFDGYTWYEYIPRSLAEVMGDGFLNTFQDSKFEEIGGRFFIRKGY